MAVPSQRDLTPAHAASARLHNDFDAVAPVYDALARLLFLGATERAQRALLEPLRAAESALIVGGGSGRFLLDYLRQAEQLGARPRVLYLELSGRMLARARARIRALLPSMSDCVEYRQGSERTLSARDGLFDAVVTNFFFDLFSPPVALEVAQLLALRLRAGGRFLLVDWIAPEARLSRLHAGWLYPAMYAFFGVVSNVQARRPPDYEAIFHELGFRPRGRALSYGGLIASLEFRLHDVAAASTCAP